MHEQKYYQIWSLHQKTSRNIDNIFWKMQKTPFLDCFWPILPTYTSWKKIQKNRILSVCSVIITYQLTKIQKNVMTQFQGSILVTYAIHRPLVLCVWLIRSSSSTILKLQKGRLEWASKSAKPIILTAILCSILSW